MSWIDSEGLPLGDRVNPPELTWLKRIIQIEDYEQRQAEFVKWSAKHLLVTRSNFMFDDLEAQRLKSDGKYEWYLNYQLKHQAIQHGAHMVDVERVMYQEIDSEELPGKQFRVTTCQIAPEKGTRYAPVKDYGDAKND